MILFIFLTPFRGSCFVFHLSDVYRKREERDDEKRERASRSALARETENSNSSPLFFPPTIQFFSPLCFGDERIFLCKSKYTKNRKQSDKRARERSGRERMMTTDKQK